MASDQRRLGPLWQVSPNNPITVTNTFGDPRCFYSYRGLAGVNTPTWTGTERKDRHRCPYTMEQRPTPRNVALPNVTGTPDVLNVAILASIFQQEERWVRTHLIRTKDSVGLPCRPVGNDYLTIKEELKRWITRGLVNHGEDDDESSPNAPPDDPLAENEDQQA